MGTFFFGTERLTVLIKTTLRREPGVDPVASVPPRTKKLQGQNFISDGAKFLISFFTSKMDGVYQGSHKNTIFSKKI